MNLLLTLQEFIKRAGLRTLAGPVLIVMILAMMVLPLPPMLLDILFTFNIAIAVMVLLTMAASAWVARRTVNMPVVDALAHT